MDPRPHASDSPGQIVPHIPLSCSLSFRLADPSDTRDLVIHPGFTPAWFRQHMELDYGPGWHGDPLRRRTSFVEMGRVLNRVFPSLRLGGRPEETPGTISQIRTCAMVAGLFGLPVEYFADNWPANRSVPLADAQADRLEVPPFRDHPLYADLMRQMDVIEREWGEIRGDLNYQGVLNTAFRLRGESIFADMIEAPDRACHILDVVRRTMVAFIDDVHARQRRSGAARGCFVTANCTVNMLSGALYREFVLPHDQALGAHFRPFGIHNCAWRVDPYVEAYSEVGPVAYIDFGLQSDLAQLRRLFPLATRAPMYSPVDLAAKPLSAIGLDLERIHDALGPCHLIVADIEAGTPPERILSFFRLAGEIWRASPDALAPSAGLW